MKWFLVLSFLLWFLTPSTFAQFDLNSLFPEEITDSEDCYLSEVDNNAVESVLYEKGGANKILEDMYIGCSYNYETDDKIIFSADVKVKDPLEDRWYYNVDFNGLIVSKQFYLDQFSQDIRYNEEKFLDQNQMSVLDRPLKYTLIEYLIGKNPDEEIIIAIHPKLNTLEFNLFFENVAGICSIYKKKVNDITEKNTTPYTFIKNDYGCAALIPIKVSEIENLNLDPAEFISLYGDKLFFSKIEQYQGKFDLKTLEKKFTDMNLFVRYSEEKVEIVGNVPVNKNFYLEIKSEQAYQSPPALLFYLYPRVEKMNGNTAAITQADYNLALSDAMKIIRDYLPALGADPKSEFTFEEDEGQIIYYRTSVPFDYNKISFAQYPARNFVFYDEYTIDKIKVLVKRNQITGYKKQDNKFYLLVVDTNTLIASVMSENENDLQNLIDNWKSSFIGGGATTSNQTKIFSGYVMNGFFIESETTNYHKNFGENFISNWDYLDEYWDGPSDYFENSIALLDYSTSQEIGGFISQPFIQNGQEMITWRDYSDSNAVKTESSSSDGILSSVWAKLVIFAVILLVLKVVVDKFGKKNST